MAGTLSLLAGLLVLFGSRGQLVSSAAEDPYTKIWTIALGHDWAGHDYLDSRGYIAGFSTDMVRAVCAAAGINCRTMWLPYNWCMDSSTAQHSVGGKALLGGWVDGCIGWVTTVDRMQILDFSMPYLAKEPIYFFVKKGNTFDPNNLVNKKIVFLDGWAWDEKCVARQSGVAGTFLHPVTQIFYAPTTDDFVAKITSGEVDAGFASLDTMAPYATQVSAVMARSFTCAIAGCGMMTRKDNDLNSYWNLGFQKLRNSGQFKKLCDKGDEDHGHKFTGKIPCLQ